MREITLERFLPGAGESEDSLGKRPIGIYLSLGRSSSKLMVDSHTAQLIYKQATAVAMLFWREEESSSGAAMVGSLNNSLQLNTHMLGTMRYT